MTEIRDYCFLAEGCTVGDNVRVFQYSNIAGHCVVGNNVYIGVRVTFTNSDAVGGDTEPVIVEDEVTIWSAATICPGVRLRRGCIIGAGAVVTRSTEPHKLYLGVPARESGL